MTGAYTMEPLRTPRPRALGSFWLVHQNPSHAGRMGGPGLSRTRPARVPWHLTLHLHRLLFPYNNPETGPKSPRVL